MNLNLIIILVVAYMKQPANVISTNKDLILDFLKTSNLTLKFIILKQ